MCALVTKSRYIVYVSIHCILALSAILILTCRLLQDTFHLTTTHCINTTDLPPVYSYITVTVYFVNTPLIHWILITSCSTEQSYCILINALLLTQICWVLLLTQLMHAITNKQNFKDVRSCLLRTFLDRSSFSQILHHISFLLVDLGFTMPIYNVTIFI